MDDVRLYSIDMFKRYFQYGGTANLLNENSIVDIKSNIHTKYYKLFFEMDQVGKQGGTGSFLHHRLFVHGTQESIISGFPHKRPVVQGFVFSFIVSFNELLNKQLLMIHNVTSL